MLPLWRLAARVHGVFAKGIYPILMGPSPGAELPVHIFGQTSIAATNKTRKMNEGFAGVEGTQGEPSDLTVAEARRVLAQAMEYQCHGPSFQGTQDSYTAKLAGTTAKSLTNEDAHCSVLKGMDNFVSLNGHMQSTVPEPTQAGTVMAGYESYLNMPGGTYKLMDKYVSSSVQAYHPSRHFSTSSKSHVSQQGAQNSKFVEDFILSDPSPQGIQGDNCVSFKLWMENCQRYNLPNCDEQLESLSKGRKTLAQVFQEQQEIIRLVAESYKQKQTQKMASETNAQGQQDYFGYSFEFSPEDPCPQGLQGDDCANYKVWAHNCRAFGFGDCSEKLKDIKSGRRTLRDVFDEQDEMIRNIVSSYQQKRSYSTSSNSERA